MAWVSPYASIYGFNAGQACVAGSRILVQRGVFDEVLERVEGIAKSIVVGDPNDPTTSMGPLISREQYEKVVGLHRGRQKETELLFGGRHGAEVVPHLPGGYWVEPTLFLAKDNSPRICRTRSSVRSAPSSPSTPTTRRSLSPTTAGSGSRQASGAVTSHGSTATSARSSRATFG